MLGFDFYRALKTYYQAQKEEALVVLKLYMSAPVAVADHSSILNDMKEWTQKLADAEDALAVLQKHFVVQNDPAEDAGDDQQD